MDERAHDPGEKVGACVELLGEVGSLDSFTVPVKEAYGPEGQVGAGSEFESHS